MKKTYMLLFILASSLMLLLAFSGCQAPVQEPPKAAAPAVPEKPKIDYNEMVFVPAGTCVIGGPADNPVTKNSSPPHDVNLKSFWIDKYEVTFDQFIQFTADSGYVTKGDWRKYYDENKSMQPVFNVIFSDAEAYAKWAGKRLPTQEEWEKAAAWDDTAKVQRRWPWGNEYKPGAANAGTKVLGDIGKYEGDVSYYGAHDMLGNVYEWVNSYYDPYPGCKYQDKFFGRKMYVVKGASVYIEGSIWYLSARSGFASNTILGMGFRCAKDGTPEDEAKYVKP